MGPGNESKSYLNLCGYELCCHNLLSSFHIYSQSSQLENLGTSITINKCISIIILRLLLCPVRREEGGHSQSYVFGLQQGLMVPYIVVIGVACCTA